MSEITGQRRAVRISDVAAAAGVSKALVSYALNDRPGVKESTRAHIVAVARSMGWTPSIRARSLSVSRAFAVGIVFQTTPEAFASDQYFTSLMAGIQSVLATSRYSLVTEVVGDGESEHDAFDRLIRDGRVDGMVVLDPRPDDPRLAAVSDAGLAYACLGRPQGPTTMPVLVYDEHQAVADAVAHLVALGHQRVAQVVGPQSGAAARLRRELYQEQLRAHGLEDGWWVEGYYTAEGGRQATEGLLDAASPPTAIIYSSDLMAIAGMGAAFARGVRVPEDLSVLGWDDVTVAKYLHPALSTVMQHPYDDGRMAATLLLEAIDGRRFDAPIATTDPVFVARESTGPASGR